MSNHHPTRIQSVRGALPPHRYAQSDITDAVAAAVTGSGGDERVLRRIHGNCQVQHRHLALPLAEYRRLETFDQANDLFLQHAAPLAARALGDALEAAGIAPAEVDLVISTTGTGWAVPALDARIAAITGLRSDIRRLPLFGLGCAAGAAGIARLRDYLVGHPDHVAALVAVELCSLNVQRHDVSMPNLVASGLFGDGAAAVVATGRRIPQQAHPTVEVVASRSRIHPGTERYMAVDIGATGPRIVLDAHVPQFILRVLRDEVDKFLAAHGLTRSDIEFWVCHTGGPKVIDAIQRSLCLGDDDIALTRESLSRTGNLGSVSVLQVLAETLRERQPAQGVHGLLLALGPGFCSELVLLRGTER